MSPCGRDELGDGHSVFLQRLDDDPGAEGGRLQQGAVDVLGAGVEREAHQHSGEVVVDERGAVAVHPVQRDQTVRSDRLLGAEPGQVLVQVLTGRFGGGAVVVGNALTQPPGEDVAHPALPRLVAVRTRHDAPVDHTADPGDVGQLLAVDDVARGGPHDGEQTAVLHRPGGGGRDVGVDVAHRDRRARPEPGQGRRFGGHRPGAGTEGKQRVFEPGGGEVREIRVEPGEIRG